MLAVKLQVRVLHVHNVGIRIFRNREKQIELMEFTFQNGNAMIVESESLKLLMILSLLTIF